MTYWDMLCTKESKRGEGERDEKLDGWEESRYSG